MCHPSPTAKSVLDGLDEGQRAARDALADKARERWSRYFATRRAIHNIIAGQGDRLLVVIGPCSIHDPAAALEYARKLKEVRTKYADTLEIVRLIEAANESRGSGKAVSL